MANATNQETKFLAWKKGIYTAAPLRMYNKVNVGGVIVDVSDGRFVRYAVPEMTALDESGFRDYVNTLKQTESSNFKEKGESFSIIFLEETLENMSKVALKNIGRAVDYVSILHEQGTGFQEDYVQLNSVVRPKEKVLKKAFVYIPERDIVKEK